MLSTIMWPFTTMTSYVYSPGCFGMRRPLQQSLILCQNIWIASLHLVPVSKCVAFIIDACIYGCSSSLNALSQFRAPVLCGTEVWLKCTGWLHSEYMVVVVVVAEAGRGGRDWGDGVCMVQRRAQLSTLNQSIACDGFPHTSGIPLITVI